MSKNMISESAEAVMARATQFCVGLEHQPGRLTKLCSMLRTNGVNIDALFVSNDTDVAWVNFVGSPVERIETALRGGDYRFFSESVLTVQAQNKPGEIERIAARLAETDVNINYIYGSGVDGHPSMIVLSVDDVAKAGQTLKS